MFKSLSVNESQPSRFLLTRSKKLYLRNRALYYNFLPSMVMQNKNLKTDGEISKKDLQVSSDMNQQSPLGF